jgi:CDP-diacylglycerol--glycerol-3-phosphate 3-phosphatidyltransferase
MNSDSPNTNPKILDPLHPDFPDDTHLEDDEGITEAEAGSETEASVTDKPHTPPKFDEMTFGTTPNILTLIRMLFVPVVVFMLFQGTPEWDLAAAWVFGAASITDWIDGYIARKQQVVTIYGKLLDPLADKFLVISSLVMLQELHRVHAVIVILMICRELAITGLRALASAEGVIIPASNSAKWKTALQMFGIPFAMVTSRPLGLPLYELGMGLIYVSVAVSLWSAVDYVIDFFRGLKASRQLKSRERKLAREARRAERLARLQQRLERAKSLLEKAKGGSSEEKSSS